MKKSYKMMRAVNRLISKYGFEESEIKFGVESLESNRHGGGYYDYAELSCRITRLHFIVSFDGTISK